jgi:hypothetical protein
MEREAMKRTFQILVAALLALGMVGSISARPTYAATDVVTTCAFNGAGSLSAVVAAAAAGDTITFNQDCTGANAIVVSPWLVIYNSLTIDGSGHDIVIDGRGAAVPISVAYSTVSLDLRHVTVQGGSPAIANVNGGTVTISDSTFSNNWSSQGGAIDNTGTATISNSTFSGNGSNEGGAIDNEALATLIISNSTFSGNFVGPRGTGGAINNAGTASIANSTFSGNSVYDLGFGGAIDNHGTLTIANSTFSGNSISPAGDGGEGGALDNVSLMTVSNSTFSGNSADFGGAILNLGGYASVTNSTISGNSANDASGGIARGGGTIYIGASIVANNTAPQYGNCLGEVDEGYNLEWTGSTDTSTGYSCGFSSANHDITGKDPQLGALQNNGGSTQTSALLTGSSALDQIPAGTSFTANNTTYTLCPSIGTTTDQRGDARPDDGETSCDIGAYEYSGPDQSPTTLSAVSGSGTYGGTAALTATLSSGTTPVSGESIAFTLNGSAVCGGSGQPTCPTTDANGVATLQNASLAGIAAGSYPSEVGASFAGDSAYSASTATGALTVGMASQSITFGALANHTYGDSPFTVSASASSGLTVSFSAGSTDQCTVAGTTVTITGVGSCTLTASQPGDANYNPATSVSRSFAIAQAAASITLDPSSLSATYDGHPHPATATTNPDGLSYGVTYTDGTNTPVISPTNAGTYEVAAMIADPNYAGSTSGTLVIAKANQSITVTGHAPASATYNSAFTVAATASSGLGVSYGSSGACSHSGPTFTMTAGTGTCTVTYDQAGNGNYNAAGEVTETVTAQQANQTITFGPLANHTFGDMPFQLNATASSGLAVSFSAGSTDQCTVSGATVTITGAGSCTVTSSQQGDANDTAAPTVSQTFSIAKASTVTTVASSANPSIVKQGVTFTVTVTAGAVSPDGTVTIKDGATILASGIQLNATGSATFTTSALAAGTHSITASYSGSANFSSSVTSTPLSQQVRYNVKVLSTSSLAIVLQLLDYNNTNVSASTLTVTAECVVPYSQTPPTACGATPVQTIAKAFGFANSYKGMGHAYSYSINSQGLTKGQQYDLLVQTDGDPIWHAVPFTF